MLVGNLALRKDGSQLRSGAETYGGGIVVSVNPFVLVSEGCDMRLRLQFDGVATPLGIPKVFR